METSLGMPFKATKSYTKPYPSYFYDESNLISKTERTTGEIAMIGYKTNIDKITLKTALFSYSITWANCNYCIVNFCLCCNVRA
jgi:hypothetical protein